MHFSRIYLPPFFRPFHVCRSSFSLTIPWGIETASLALLIVAGLANPVWAGSEPAPGAQGDASATGVVDFSGGSSGAGGGSTTSTGGSVSTAAQASMNQASASLGSGGSLSNVSSSVIFGTPISRSQIEAAGRAMVSAASVSNRRGDSASFASVRSAVQEYGGSPETAELTATLLQSLVSPSGELPSLDVTQATVEFALSMQGLGTGLGGEAEVSADQLLGSIEAFNQLINQLAPLQLIQLSEDEQLQELKLILETLAEAAGA